MKTEKEALPFGFAVLLFEGVLLKIAFRGSWEFTCKEEIQYNLEVDHGRII